MSDNDTQDTNITGSDDFASSLELESESSATDATIETTETSPAEDTQAEPTEEKSEVAPDNTTPPEEETEATNDEEKSESEVKQMSRAERAAYYQSLERQTRQEVTQAISSVYQPQPVDQLQQHYLAQGYSEGEALMLARQDVAEQKTQIAEANAEIVELNANLRVDSLEAQSTFDWMNPAKTDAYDKDMHQLTADLYSGYITTDPRTGQIIEARKTPMEIARIVDKIRNSGSAKAQLRAQKNAEQQLASVSPQASIAPPAGNKSPEEKQADALNDAFNLI